MEEKRLADGRIVVDEMCTCGHKRSEHSFITTVPGSLPQARDRGHGHCHRCGCDQFTWKEFILKGEKK